MICVPKCKTCTGLCQVMETRAVARKRQIKKTREVTLNRESFLYMPCGCLALPVELIRIFRSDIREFFCDQHGKVKVTKKWLKEASLIGPLKQIPSEYGYQVTIDDNANN